MKTKQIIDAYENAIKTNTWDFPKGHEFNSAMEIYELVVQGKTIYHFARQAVVKFGTITSGVMAFGGINHVTKNTRSSIRKGVIHALEITSKIKQHEN